MQALLALFLFLRAVEPVYQPPSSPALLPVAPYLSSEPLGPRSDKPILKKPLIATVDNTQEVAALLPQNEPKAAKNDVVEEKLLKIVSNVDQRLKDQAAALSVKFGDVDVSESAHSPQDSPIKDKDQHKEFHQLLKQAKDLLDRVGKLEARASDILDHSSKGGPHETTPEGSTTTTTAAPTTTTTTTTTTTAAPTTTTTAAPATTTTTTAAPATTTTTTAAPTTTTTATTTTTTTTTTAAPATTTTTSAPAYGKK